MHTTRRDRQHQRAFGRNIVQPLTQFSFCHWSYQSFRSHLALASNLSDARVLGLLLRYVNCRRGWLRAAVAYRIPQANREFSRFPRDGVPGRMAGCDIVPLRAYFGIPQHWHDDAATNVILHTLAIVLPAIVDDAQRLVCIWNQTVGDDAGGRPIVVGGGDVPLNRAMSCSVART